MVFKRLLVNVLIAFAVLLGVEIGLRVAGWPRPAQAGYLEENIARWQSLDPELSQAIAQLGRYEGRRDAPRLREAYVQFLSTLEQDRRLHYRLRSNLRERLVNWQNPIQLKLGQTWTLNTNARGFRGPELPGLPDGTFRIACIGDSTTYGWGVEASEAFPARLQERLNRTHNRNVEVFNLGCPGFTSFQGIVLLEDLFASGVNLVICGFGSNDHVKATLDEEAVHRRLNSVMARTAMAISHLRISALLQAGLARLGPLQASPELVPRVAIEEYSSNLSRIASRSRAEGAHVFFLDTLSDEPSTPQSDLARLYSTEMASVAGSSGSVLLRFSDLVAAGINRWDGTRDLADRIESRQKTWGASPWADSSRILFQVDPIHPDACGHDLIAAAIAEQIDQRGLLFKNIAPWCDVIAGEHGAASPILER